MGDGIEGYCIHEFATSIHHADIVAPIPVSHVDARWNPRDTLSHPKNITAQQRELLYIGFYLWYVLEWLFLLAKYHNGLKAYFHIRFEKEAYNHQDDLDKTDYYAAISPSGDDTIVAAGGLLRDTIRCIAVDDAVSDEHLANRLVTHLMEIVQRRGFPTVKVFTKPKYEEIFKSLAFNTIAITDNVVFMENSRQPLNRYIDHLRTLAKPGVSGVIVMNCNPFTLGHKYLVEYASRQVDNLYIIPLLDSSAGFNYEERREMICRCSSFRKNRYADARLRVMILFHSYYSFLDPDRSRFFSASDTGTMDTYSLPSIVSLCRWTRTPNASCIVSSFSTSSVRPKIGRVWVSRSVSSAIAKA